MKLSLLRAGVVASVLAAGLMSLGAAPASAAPAVAGSPGVIEICDGVSMNTVDMQGVPLTPTQIERMKGHLQQKCDGTAVKVSGDGVVVPYDMTPIGYLAAHLNLTPGNMTWFTSASSMPVSGFYKDLSCEVQIGSGAAWTNCGTATGTGSSLTTRTNWICPAKGLKVTVEATLDYRGQTYWDAAYGTTL